jgi:hypothetical protein
VNTIAVSTDGVAIEIGPLEEEVGEGGRLGLDSSPQATKPIAPKARAELKIRGAVNLELIVIPFFYNLKVKINKIWSKRTKYLSFYNNTKIKLQRVSCELVGVMKNIMNL